MRVMVTLCISCYSYPMKLVSWNVNGIRAVHKKGLFLPFIEKHKPDVLCLQETKAERGQAAIDLPDYEEYWNSAEKKGYSGTAIFVKKSVHVRSVRFGLPEHLVKKYHLADDGYGNPNTEGRVIAVEVAQQADAEKGSTEHSPLAKGVWVVTVYTPNSKEDLSRLDLRHKQWDPAFLAYMQELEEGVHSEPGRAGGQPVIFCGDLNVAHRPDDLSNPKANEGKHGYTAQEREGIDQMIDAGFADTFRYFTPTGNGHYTWWSHWANARERNIGWRIDYFFASKKLLPHLAAATILPTILGSDHCPIVLEIKD